MHAQKKIWSIFNRAVKKAIKKTFSLVRVILPAFQVCVIHKVVFR